MALLQKANRNSKRGDKRYEECMALASEILARAHEQKTGPYPEIENITLLKKFNDLDNELHLIRTLTGLNSAETETNENRNSILIFKSDAELEVKSYRDSSDALKALFKLEQEHPELDIVLVKADSNEEIRMAFRNYFSDAKDFIRLLTDAQSILEQQGNQAIARD